MVVPRGFEPCTPPYQGGVLPLNYGTMVLSVRLELTTYRLEGGYAIRYTMGIWRRVKESNPQHFRWHGFQDRFVPSTLPSKISSKGRTDTPTLWL